jgi:Arp2/3 complex, 34 kD subunit p34-Arc
MIEEISVRFSCFKRDFLGAPIRRALQGLHKGASSPNFNCELSYRGDEKFWVLAGKAEVSIYFALQFDNITDRALARIFLLEFTDS